MNITFLIIGIGLGFFIAACLMFWVIAISIKGSASERARRQKVDDQMLAQQRQIMFATCRFADVLVAIHKTMLPPTPPDFTKLGMAQPDTFSATQPGVDA